MIINCIVRISETRTRVVVAEYVAYFHSDGGGWATTISLLPTADAMRVGNYLIEIYPLPLNELTPAEMK